LGRLSPIYGRECQPGGALIWIGEDRPLDSELIIRVEPDGPDETWADLVTTLLYKLPEVEKLGPVN